MANRFTVGAIARVTYRHCNEAMKDTEIVDATFNTVELRFD